MSEKMLIVLLALILTSVSIRGDTKCDCKCCEPRILPELVADGWIIQYNPTTKRFRPSHKKGGPLWFDCTTEREAIEKLNEYHLSNIKKAKEESAWKDL